MRYSISKSIRPKADLGSSTVSTHITRGDTKSQAAQTNMVAPTSTQRRTS